MLGIVLNLGHKACIKESHSGNVSVTPHQTLWV